MWFLFFYLHCRNHRLRCLELLFAMCDAHGDTCSTIDESSGLNVESVWSNKTFIYRMSKNIWIGKSLWPVSVFYRSSSYLGISIFFIIIIFPYLLHTFPHVTRHLNMGKKKSESIVNEAISIKIMTALYTLYALYALYLFYKYLTPTFSHIYTIHKPQWSLPSRPDNHD